MKIQIENLKAFMQSRVLTLLQAGDAIAEFDKLVAYAEKLEQLNLDYVIKGEADSVCCTNCSWVNAKYEYRCEGCLLYSNFEQTDL